MSAPIDPPRLRPDSTLGLLLDEARSELLDDESRARAWRSIEATAALGTAPVSAKSSGLLGKLSAASLAKVGIASLALLLIGGAFTAALRRAPSPTSVSAAPSSLVAETAPPAVAETAPANDPAPATNPAPANDPAPLTNPAPAPTPKASATAAPVAPTAPAPSTAKSAPTPEEGRLLLEAKAAISADPRRALALTAAHAKAFPSSALGAERESIAVEALARLGRCGEARARAQRFLAVFRSSPHRRLVARLEAGCGS